MTSQQTGDLISREDTLTAFADYVGSGMSMDDYDALWDIVLKMPPANPWIPVSERLPEEDDFYLVTAKVGNEFIIDISEYTPKNDFWDILHEIVAWLPLPKPYKAESEVKDKE